MQTLALCVLLFTGFSMSGVSQARAQDNPFMRMQHHAVTITSDSLQQRQLTERLRITLDSQVVLTGPGQIVVTTGPESDMLSYRVGGLRNPTLVVEEGQAIEVMFVNTDADMTHDLRFGVLPQPVPVKPSTKQSVGTSEQSHASANSYSGEVITLHSMATGIYQYFCSIRGHAKGGMNGIIRVVPRGELPVVSTPQARPGTAPDSVQTPGKHDHTEIEQSRPSTETPQGKKTDSATLADAGMSGMEMKGSEGASHSSSMTASMPGMLPTETMAQDGSGTSTLPAASPMYMWMWHLDEWMLMMHGSIMPRYTSQAGARGGHTFDAPNMEMLMASRPIGENGQFTAHLMMSLDPLTETLRGYPLLLQTGESYKGERLVDIQHPHDLFAEIAAAYAHQVGERTSLFLYAGYPGEPALGPTVFMHRPSGLSNPNAPLGHHWLDATHVTFGVLTLGVASGDWKFEGSAFNGREPDEFRYSFDPVALNSYSGRISYSPSEELSMQVSSGLLHDAERNGVNVLRTTASAIYSHQQGADSWWSATLAWGANREGSEGILHAGLIESEVAWNRWRAYGRAELVQKTNEELNIQEDESQINNVGAVTLGVVRTVFSIAKLDADLGAQVTANILPSSLTGLYGNVPVSFGINIALHPSRIDH